MHTHTHAHTQTRARTHARTRTRARTHTHTHTHTVYCVPCHFMQSHIRKVHACLAVTCHLYFRQNDRDLLRATAVTFPFLSDRNPLRTPSDQTTRHFFSQSDRPAMFSVPGCCLPPPQVCLLSVSVGCKLSSVYSQ